MLKKQYRYIEVSGVFTSTSMVLGDNVFSFALEGTRPMGLVNGTFKALTADSAGASQNRNAVTVLRYQARTTDQYYPSETFTGFDAQAPLPSERVITPSGSYENNEPSMSLNLNFTGIVSLPANLTASQEYRLYYSVLLKQEIV